LSLVYMTGSPISAAFPSAPTPIATSTRTHSNPYPLIPYTNTHVHTLQSMDGRMPARRALGMSHLCAFSLACPPTLTLLRVFVCARSRQDRHLTPHLFPHGQVRPRFHLPRRPRRLHRRPRHRRTPTSNSGIATKRSAGTAETPKRRCTTRRRGKKSLLGAASPTPRTHWSSTGPTATAPCAAPPSSRSTRIPNQMDLL
jgi:hypothetical protein